MKCQCKNCGSTFETPYDFKRMFCGDPCKIAYTEKLATELKISKGELVECMRCNFSWKLRGQTVTYCPRCRYKPTFTKEVEDFVMRPCQYCGKLRNVAKILCNACNKPNTDQKYQYGLTIGNWRKFIEYLHIYEGEEDIVLQLRLLLIDIYKTPEPVKITEDEIQSESVPIEKELTLDEAVAELAVIPDPT